MKNVVYLPAALDACAMWRLFFPHLRIPNSRFLFNPQHKLPVEELPGIDVGVVQRLASHENLRAIALMKQIGMKVIYDLDDNLWNLPKYNSAYGVFQKIRDNFPICMRACNAVTVSTPALKAAVQKAVKSKIPVHVIPNCVDFDMYYPLPKLQSEKVTVGWAGTATHDGDIADVFAMIPDLLKATPAMNFECVGMKLPDTLQGVSKVSQRAFVPIAEYPSRLASWRWDIMLAPLLDNLFNRSKSNIKILEAAALRTPILFSPVATYLDFSRLNKELDYLVCRTPQQWKDKIRSLVNEPAKREHYGELLYTVARNNYSTLISAQKWQALFESVQ